MHCFCSKNKRKIDRFCYKKFDGTCYVKETQNNVNHWDFFGGEGYLFYLFIYLFLKFFCYYKTQKIIKEICSEKKIHGKENASLLFLRKRCRIVFVMMTLKLFSFSQCSTCLSSSF